MAFLAPILVLGIQTLVSVIGSYVMLAAKMVEAGGKLNKEVYTDLTRSLTDPNYLSVILLIYSVAAICIFAPWWSKKRVDFDFRTMSFRGFKAGRVIIGIVLFVLGAQITANYLVSFLSAIFPKELVRYSQIMKQAGLDMTSLTPVMAIYTAILGPIAEELAFRGLSLGYFKKSLPSFALANIMQALLFGFIHMNFIQGAYAFMIGLLLGYVAHRTGSLLLSIVLHICFNSSSFILQAVSPKAMNGGAFLAFATLVLAMMAVYAGIVMLVSAQPIAKER